MVEITTLTQKQRAERILNAKRMLLVALDFGGTTSEIGQPGRDSQIHTLRCLVERLQEAQNLDVELNGEGEEVL